ncbi:ABC transporter transmembrane domain-containing protein, partial [Acinetobacter baumannii]|nr:ABC transporter transmembrane domain-containing protein [Acinetobacter baumannii]
MLALIRSKVFNALRRLAPAKMEGRKKGELIAVLTSDIELLEVFYAHTISPIAIAVITSIIVLCIIGSFNLGLMLVALLGYVT